MTKIDEIINEFGFFTKKEIIENPNSYRVKARGYVTASKLKTFINSPYLYKLMRVDETIPEDDDSIGHFEKGTGFHKLLEVGEEEWAKEYQISDKFLKPDLQEKLIEMGFEPKTVMKSTNTMPILREMYYGTEKWLDMNSKRELTNSEARDIIGMYLSVAKQKSWNIFGQGYNKEKTIKINFAGIEIGVKPDRFVIFKNGDITQSIIYEDYLAEIYGLSLEQRIEYAERHNYSIHLRDFKTSRNIDTLKKSILYEDDKFGYLISMSFYYTLIFIKTGIRPEIYLDIVESSSPYYCEILSLPKETMEYHRTIIESALRRLRKCIDDNIREMPTRDDRHKPYIKKYRPYLNIQQTQPTYLEGLTELL